MSDLVVTSAFLPRTNEISLQVFDLTDVWSHSDSNVIELDEILALTATFYMFIKLNLSPQQRYPHTLPELLTKKQPDGAPVLHNTGTIQRITHNKFRILELQEFELATLTHMAWIDMFSRRFSLWQQQQQQRQPHLALHFEFLAAFAYQIVAAHVQNFSSCFLSPASQMSATAWFVSALLWVLLSRVAEQ